MRVDFSKCEAQSLAFDALQPGNTVCLAFGRGVGKSTVQRLFWYIQIATAQAEGRAVRIVCLMPTLKQANRSHLPYFSELARNGEWGFLGALVNKTTMKASFPGGSWIQWVSAENANDNRGIRCDYVSIDEADDIDVEIYNGIVLPWLSEPHSLKIRVIGGTPRRGRFGLLWKAFKELPKKYPGKCFSFHATAYDAPLLVDPAIVEEAKETTPPATFAREWLCDFDSAEGLVYPMFKEELHVRTPPKEFDEILIGVDHGFEHPAVFLVLGVVGYGRDAVVYVIHEYCQSYKTQDELADMALVIHKAYPTARWFADSSGAQDIEAYKRKVNKQIMAATHKVEDGVSTVATMLSPRLDGSGKKVPRLFVDPSCVCLIAEMGKYRRKRDPQNKERILDAIEKRDDDCQDSLRYPIYHVFAGVYSTKNVIEDHNTDDADEYEYA